MENHKGQISFPGGMEALDDASPWDTAVRETEEEIGVPRKAILPLGELPEVVTVTGFRIRPFVGAIPYPFEFRRGRARGGVGHPDSDPRPPGPDARRGAGRRSGRDGRFRPPSTT